MDVTSSVDAPCGADALFAVVQDLTQYPEWLTIVTKAVLDDGRAGRDGSSNDPAWLVDLRGRLGPLARSKRLRMVRTAHDDDGDVRRVRFERRELDGRQHSAWVLEAEVVPRDDGSTLTMRLHYGGSFGGALLARMLRDEIEASRPRLLAYVS